MRNVKQLCIVSYNMHGFFQDVETVMDLICSSLCPDRGSAPNMGMFPIRAPLIYVPYVTCAKDVRHIFCAPAMPKSSKHILTSI